MKGLVCVAAAGVALAALAPAGALGDPGGRAFADAEGTGLVHPAPDFGWGARPVRTGALTQQAKSTNWSGYADTSDTFTAVAGSWVVPAVSCTWQSSYSSFWVGLDGYSSGSVEQLGTDSDCSRGRPTYYAWYELYPAGAYEISGTVSPGDTLTASVQSGSPTSYTLTITDTSTSHSSWKASGTLSTTAAEARSSAEWVAEAPSSCSRFGCQVLPLANFGTVSFSAAQATDAGGKVAAISGFSDSLIEMVNNSGIAKALPGPLTAGGSAFTDTWKHS